MRLSPETQVLIEDRELRLTTFVRIKVSQKAAHSFANAVAEYRDALIAQVRADALEEAAKVCDDLYNEDADPKDPRPGIWQVHPEYAIAAKAIRRLSATKEEPCKTCGGSGKVSIGPNGELWHTDQDCHACDGTGKVNPVG